MVLLWHYRGSSVTLSWQKEKNFLKVKRCNPWRSLGLPRFLGYCRIKSPFRKGRNTFNPKTLKEGDIWESNPIHFKAITANDKYIYCLYWGMTEQQAKNNQRRHSFAGQIVVLRWDGSVYKILTTRRKITSIAVSESGDYIIGYDEGRFFISTI